MKIENSGFSSRLKEERARLGLNQEDFGRLGGVGKIAQLNYEKGHRVPAVDYLFALSDSGAGVDVEYLLTGMRNTGKDDSAQLEDRSYGLLSIAISMVAGLADGCVVKMSANELSSMAATLYRSAMQAGALDMSAEEVAEYLEQHASGLFSGWLIGRGVDVKGADHPFAPSSSIR